MLVRPQREGVRKTGPGPPYFESQPRTASQLGDRCAQALVLEPRVAHCVGVRRRAAFRSVGPREPEVDHDARLLPAVPGGCVGQRVVADDCVSRPQLHQRWERPEPPVRPGARPLRRRGTNRVWKPADSVAVWRGLHLSLPTLPKTSGVSSCAHGSSWRVGVHVPVRPAQWARRRRAAVRMLRRRPCARR